ncbi:hypothetical protein HYX06_01760 [Candidatus Woesearchaeota archaeon]|nr:hypothetical protein [Candidatus Woesearchaeota archaeon]
MKKFVLILLFLAIFIYGCWQVQPADTTPPKKSMSDIQITACNTAHDADTCDTRLAELGIVLKEDCCEALGKCC